MKKNFKVEVDCAICAQKIEEAIKKMNDVKDCSINFMTQKMMIEMEDSIFDVAMKKVIKVAKKVEPDFEIGWNE